MSRIIILLIITIFPALGAFALGEDDGYDERTLCWWKDGLAYRYIDDTAIEMMLVDPVHYSLVHFDGLTGYSHLHGDLNIPSELIFDGKTIIVTLIDGGTANHIGVSNIIIPESIIGIGGYSFNGCYKLESVHLPENLKYLEYDIFNSCPQLSKVNLPKNIEKFDDCFNDLNENLVVESAIKNPWHVSYGWDCFKTEHERKPRLIVPEGCRQKYIDAGWELRFSEITENGESDVTAIPSETESGIALYYDMTGKQVDPAELRKGEIVIKVTDGKSQKIAL